MKTNKTAALMLLLLAAAGCVIACSDAAEPPVEEQTGAATTAEQTEVEEDPAYGRTHVKDDLPETMDFGSQTVRVLSRSADYDTRIEFLAEEASGDVVEDAVYNRNLKVSERLNITMQVIEVNETRHEDSGVNTLIRKSVTAGSDDYDLVGNHMSGITRQITNNYFTDLQNVNHLNLEQPWWNASYLDAVSIDGKTYIEIVDATEISSATLARVSKCVRYGKGGYKAALTKKP